MLKVWRDLSWTTGSLIGARALAFIATIIVARTLPATEFAVYLVFVALAVIAITLADGGFFPLVTRLASRHADVAVFGFARLADRARAPLWGAALVLSVVIALSGMRHAALVPLLAVAAIAQAQMETLSGDLWAHNQFRAAALLRLAAGVLAVIGAGVLPLVEPTALGAMIVFAASRAIPVTALRGLYPRSPSAFRKAVTWRRSLPFGLTTVITAAYVQSDVVLLAAFGTSAVDLGTYGLGYSVLVGLQLIPSSISATLFPRIARTNANRAGEIFQGGLLVSYVVAAGLLALVLLDLSVLFLVFGSTYAEGADQIRLLLLVLLPLAISQMGIAALQARNRPRATLFIALATMVVNLSLHVVLIGALGVRGAVLSTLAAELFSAAAVLTVVNRVGLGDFRGAACVLVLPSIAVGLSDAPSWTLSLAIGLSLFGLWATNGLGLRAQVNHAVQTIRPQSQLP